MPRLDQVIGLTFLFSTAATLPVSAQAKWEITPRIGFFAGTKTSSSSVTTILGEDYVTRYRHEVAPLVGTSLSLSGSRLGLEATVYYSRSSLQPGRTTKNQPATINALIGPPGAFQGSEVIMTEPTLPAHVTIATARLFWNIPIGQRLVIRPVAGTGVIARGGDAYWGTKIWSSPAVGVLGVASRLQLTRRATVTASVEDNISSLSYLASVPYGRFEDWGTQHDVVFSTGLSISMAGL